MKKMIAIALSVIMLLGLCACGTEGGDATNGSVEHTVPAGKFILSCGASFEVVYDEDGLVISVAGLNDAGIVIAVEDEAFLGKSCAEVASALVSASKDAKYLETAKYILLKQGVSSQLPGTHFLEGIAGAITTAAGDIAKLTVVEEKDLLEGGYLSLDVAKALLLNYLDMEAFEEFRGGTEIVEEHYAVTVGSDGDSEEYIIDAFTGEIALAAGEENWDDPNMDESIDGEGVGQEEDPFYDEDYDANLEADPAPDVDLELGG